MNRRSDAIVTVGAIVSAAFVLVSIVLFNLGELEESVFTLVAACYLMLWSVLTVVYNGRGDG